MQVVPREGRWLRLCGLVYGLLVFLWLSPEDSLIWSPVALGVAGVLLLLRRWLLRGRGGRMPLLLLAAGMGAAAGAGGIVVAAALMFFKNALHAHEVADYPLGLLLGLLARAPLWGLVGLLIGIGLVLYGMAARAGRGEG